MQSLFRKPIVLRSLLLAAAALWIANTWQPGRLHQASASEAAPKIDATWLRVASDAANFARFLLDNHPETIAPSTKSRIFEAVARFDAANRRRGLLLRYRNNVSPAEVKAGLTEVDRAYAEGARQVAAALSELPGLTRWIDTADEQADAQLEISAPFGDTLFVVHRQGDSQQRPAFETREIDFGDESPAGIEFPDGNFFGAIVLNNIPTGNPAGNGRRTLVLRSGADQLALQIRTSVPPTYRTRFRVLGDAGEPTEATVAVYSEGGRLVIPESALDFSGGGFHYTATKFRNLVNAKYWAGDQGFDRAFFVRGAFEVDLPPGEYRILASKGPEYVAVDDRVTVEDAATSPHTIRLKRWTDMSSQGWHSGDCHIHYERLDPAADERLRLWTQAEDLRMGNILRMGDARETFFAQRAWGKKGRANWPRLSLVPGQEDPRTSVIGHTISLNLPRPVRFEPSYYLYGRVFDEVHRIGGLTGYAHAHDGLFLVDRDMAISIARGKVDFVEICEFGRIGVDFYYEFLNLGFRLTAAAGSDVPWGARQGATVGDSRVYAHTGGPFDPDEWFNAIKNGRTFVTVGPMLEFTVDGELPGARIKREAGDKLAIRARAAIGDSRIPFEQLEIVANGEVIHSSSRKAKEGTIELSLPLEHGLWIAARTMSNGQIGAHTTPIYVTVGNDPHWNREEAPRLVEKRLRSLNEVEQLLDAAGEGIGDGRQGNWENATAFRQGAEELRSAISEARQVYRQLIQ